MGLIRYGRRGISFPQGFHHLALPVFVIGAQDVCPAPDWCGDLFAVGRIDLITHRLEVGTLHMFDTIGGTGDRHVQQTGHGRAVGIGHRHPYGGQACRLPR